MALLLAVEEEVVHAERDATHHHADIRHVEDGKAHEQGLKHVGDIAQQGPVNQVAHRPGQHHGQGGHGEGAGKDLFHQQHGQQDGHHQRHNGQNPGMLLQQREGRAGVLHIGELENMGEKGEVSPQGDVGPHQELDRLVQHHQGHHENGV